VKIISIRLTYFTKYIYKSIISPLHKIEATLKA